MATTTPETASATTPETLDATPATTPAAAASTTYAAGASGPTKRRTLMRQILPIDRDFDVLPLYVDIEGATLDADKYEIGANKVAREVNAAMVRQNTTSGETIHPDQIQSRTALRVRSGEKISFGTYFNAFPASYWRRWTVVSAVRLTVVVTGRGATVTVYKSASKGHSQRVDSVILETDTTETFDFELSLKPFTDGGWYWYDVVAGDDDVVVQSAEWSAEVPADRAEHGTVDMAITTMNNPEMCVALLGQLAADADLRPYLDTVMLMEQGTKKVAATEDFPAVAESFGSTLRVIEQGNLGGSGGYARGQLESVRKGTATYALMMDDDVVCEPESIIRGVAFGDLCRRPTIVGGHMFNLYEKSRLHSFGEVVTPYKFWWQSAPGVWHNWDLAGRNLRSTRWLHNRVDVEFNGWFSCMIPRVVMEEIGLSLPLFIKWDDAEYGLRAKEAGYPTVTFPGAAVWHIPWTDKNDALDWQAYFHVRNRFVAAMLHTVYPRGGRIIRESLNHQIAFLCSMQYSTVRIRHQALLDLLEGPDALHGMLPTKLAEINALRKQYPDAQLEADPDAFPKAKRTKPPRKGRENWNVPTGRDLRRAGIMQPLRQLKPPRPLSRRYPEVEVRAVDAKWWILGRYDSAVVSMNDGTSAAFYQRQPATVRAMLGDIIDVHRRLWLEWPRLQREYRDKLAEITSPEAWEETFRPWLDQPATAPDGTDGTETIASRP